MSLIPIGIPFDVNYFIEKFSNIPADRWTINQYEDSSVKDCPKFDAQGFCGMNSNNKYLVLSADTIHEVPYYLHEAWCLIQIFKKTSSRMNVGAINNGTISTYNQKTAKDRILARLYDIKKIEKQQDINSEMDEID